MNKQDLAVEMVLVCQFDKFQGKRIIQSHPKLQQTSEINNDSFSLIAELILPRDELCGRFLALQFKQDYFLMGFPTIIRNDKAYLRSKYIYSVLMLVRKEKFLASRDGYYEVIRKVSYFFATLEQEKQILYNLNRPCVKQLLKTIYMDFNLKKQCFLQHQCQYYAFVGSKKLPKLQQIIIRPEQVPITCLTDQDIELIEIPDVQALLKEIAKGQQCVKKIAANLNKSIQDVSEYIRVAVCYGMVAMVDLFSLKNVYVLTPQIHDFLKNQKQLLKMKQYCFKLQNPRPTPQQLLYIVLLFNRTKCIQDILKTNSKVFQKVVSLLRLVRYCLLKGILKRCHQVLINPNTNNRKFIDKEIYMKYFKASFRDSMGESDTSLENTIRQKNEEFTVFVKNHATMDEVVVGLGVRGEMVREMVRELGVENVLSS